MSVKISSHTAFTALSRPKAASSRVASRPSGALSSGRNDVGYSGAAFNKARQQFPFLGLEVVAGLGCCLLVPALAITSLVMMGVSLVKAPFQLASKGISLVKNGVSQSREKMFGPGVASQEPYSTSERPQYVFIQPQEQVVETVTAVQPEESARTSTESVPAEPAASAQVKPKKGRHKRKK